MGSDAAPNPGRGAIGPCHGGVPASAWHHDRRPTSSLLQPANIRDDAVIGALIRRWRARTTAKALARYPAEAWEQAWEDLPLLAGLGADETQGLRTLAALFLRSKTLEAVQGASLEPRDQIAIGLQACLPILHLGLSWYQGWYAVIVYPEEFVPEREHIDADGVVWIENEIKSAGPGDPVLGRCGGWDAAGRLQRRHPRIGP